MTHLTKREVDKIVEYVVDKINHTGSKPDQTEILVRMMIGVAVGFWIREAIANMGKRKWK